jgi:hypothetical protein
LGRNATPFPSQESSLATFHVADGAYADNEGVVTSVDWINRLLVHYSRGDSIDQRPFDRVLLIRIQAFPRRKAREAAETSNLAGWRAALLGPFDTMMQVRSASQTERGDLEINLLTRATLAEVQAARERAERELQASQDQVRQLELLREELFRLTSSVPELPAEAVREVLAVQDKLHVAEKLLERVQERGRRAAELVVESVVFDFQPVDHVRIPMSWKLTTKQKQQVVHAWHQMAEGRLPAQPLAVLDKYFTRVDASNRSSLAAPSIGE